MDLRPKSNHTFNTVIETAKYPRVSVGIFTFNRCSALKRCLDSIAAQDYPLDRLELIIIDDASTDATPKEIPAYLKDLERRSPIHTSYIRNPRNIQIAAARRLFAEKVSYPIVAFIDDDVYLEADCLKVLINYMVRHPSVGVIAPRCVYAADPKKTAHSANFVGTWTGRYWSKESNHPIQCDWVYSACCLARKEVLEKTGGFWPGYYFSHEDVDFCLQAKRAGFGVVCHPDAVARHEVDLSQPKRKHLYYLYRNKLILIRRNFPLLRKIVALSVVLFLGMPKYLLESIRFNKKAVWSEICLIFLSVWHGFLGKTGILKDAQ